MPAHIDEAVGIARGAVVDQVVRELVGADDPIPIGVEESVELIPPGALIDGPDEVVVVAREERVELRVPVKFPSASSRAVSPDKWGARDDPPAFRV